jgi:hypothetical protein
MTMMLDHWHDDVTSKPVAHLRPAMLLRGATPNEAADIAPWCHASGENDFEVVAFADGGNKHAPEVVSVLRDLLSHAEPPVKLIYAHRGQKIESMMPLLPSLLFALGYRGATCAMRIPPQAGPAEAALQIRRFAATQVPEDGAAVLVIDWQERLAPAGRLTPEDVEISVLWHRAPAVARVPAHDHSAASERPAR